MQVSAFAKIVGELSEIKSPSSRPFVKEPESFTEAKILAQLTTQEAARYSLNANINFSVPSEQSMLSASNIMNRGFIQDSNSNPMQISDSQVEIESNMLGDL